LKKHSIGVLALQGDFSKHALMIKALGHHVIEVRKPDQLKECDALVIPGGESTVMLRQIDFIKMRETLIDFASKKPVFGTCAGLILLSKTIKKSTLVPLGLLDVVVERNAYGRQIDSFETVIECGGISTHTIPAIFIRAPRITSVGAGVEVLGTLEGDPVIVRQENLLGATFHPELTSDYTIYHYFLNQI
jgi:pyridoxal 5'-phosphate synthase pdxT subunit